MPQKTVNDNGRDSPEDGFFCGFNQLIDVWLPHLSHGQLKVYLVYKRHSGPRRDAYPSIETIAAKTGMDARSVTRCVRDLERLGFLVTVKPGGGRNNSALRRVTIPPTNPPKKSGAKRQVNPDSPVTLSNQINGDPGVTLSGQINPDPTAHETLTVGCETLTVGCLNPDSPVTPTEVLTEQRTDQQHQHAANAADAACDSSGEEGEADHAADDDTDPTEGMAWTALRDAGVNDPKRSAILKRLPGLTAEIVQHLQGTIGNSAKNPVAVLITQIESEGAHLISEAKAGRLPRQAVFGNARRPSHKGMWENLSLDMPPVFNPAIEPFVLTADQEDAVSQVDKERAEQKVMLDKIIAAAITQYESDPATFDARKVRMNTAFDAYLKKRLNQICNELSNGGRLSNAKPCNPSDVDPRAQVVFAVAIEDIAIAAEQERNRVDLLMRERQAARSKAEAESRAKSEAETKERADVFKMRCRAVIEFKERVGDAAWQNIVAAYYAQYRGELERHGFRTITQNSKDRDVFEAYQRGDIIKAPVLTVNEKSE